MQTLPCVIRNRQTNREEAGLIEIFVPVSANGRCHRSPLFQPFHQLPTTALRVVVIQWLKHNRPDLLRPLHRIK